MLNILLLGLTSLLTDFSSEMITPILPFFIQSVGGGGVAIGLIFGFGDALAAILKVFSGYMADKSRKYLPLVFIGYLFSAIAKFGYAISAGWAQIAGVRSIERMGKGFRDAPRDAIVSESVSDTQRGRGFGIQRAMDSAGAVIGSAAALVFFVAYGFSFRTIFFVSAFIGVTALMPIMLVNVPEHLRIPNHKQVAFEKLSGRLRKFIAIATLFSLANFSVAFFILRAQASFHGISEHAALGLTLAVYIFFNVFDTAFSGPAGALSDRIGRKKVILAGYGLFALVSMGFLLLSFFTPGNRIDFAALLLLFGLYGGFKALIDASQRAFVSDLSPYELRGTALGTFETFTGLVAIPAGLFAGLLWDMAPVYTFAYGSVLALLAVVFLNHFKER